ncbi:MAG: asparagine synthase-related protein [Candidatus Krumholzibacteriales bacterium]
MPRLFGVADFNDTGRLEELAGITGGGFSAAAGAEAETETAGEAGVILGLVRDRQPFEGRIMTSEDGSYSLAYAGFIPSTGQLCSRHDIPAGTGTAQVIMALYRKFGEEFLGEIPGMFSLAVHDREKELLLIAGDRSGAFPLYYYCGGGRFIFASSLNAVRGACGGSDLRTASVVEHLLFDALYGRYTFYRDIFLTEFGGYLAVDLKRGRVRRGRYFSYEQLFDIGLYRGSRGINAPGELTAHARSCLSRILEGKDLSGFGLSCGGGIDCSYLGGVLKDIDSPLPVLCTSVSDARVQEDSMAADTAGRLGVELHTSYLRSEDFYPLLLRSIIEFGQPIVHPSTPKFYAGSDSEGRRARPNHIMGVASDLLFGGYGNVISFYKYVKLRSLFGLIPSKLRTAMKIGTVELEKIKLQLRMRNCLGGLAALGMGNLERGADQRRIEEALSPIEDRNEREVKVLMLQNLFDYQQHLLNRRYEISAGCGISQYYPFLDLEMVKFAVNLPVSHCVSWRESKIVVRRAALPYLGEGLAARSKYGGDVPINKWLAPLKGLLDDGFVREALGYDSGRLGDTLEGDVKLLWNMIDIELWGRLCIRGEEPEAILDRVRASGTNCSPFE